VSAADERLLQAFALHQQGRLSEADQGYRSVLELQPEHFDALHLSGVLALQTNQPEHAVELIRRALELNPQVAAVHLNHGAALAAMKHYEAARSSYECALALDPAYADAHFNLANALRELGQHRAAAASYGRAAALRPDMADAHQQRGCMLFLLAEHEAAVGCFDRALALRPGAAGLYNERGAALYALGRLPAALADFDRAVGLEPANARAQHHRGLALHALQRNAEAVESYERAIRLDGDLVAAQTDRAAALFELKEYEAALAGYDQVLRLRPDYRHVRGVSEHLRMRVCDWRDFDARLADLGARLGRGEAACPPGALVALSDSAALQLRAATVWTREECPPDETLPAIAIRAPCPRIRLGYFSADFHDHATLYLMAGLLEQHDRAHFEVTALSFGPASQHPLRRRAEAACERFIDVRGRTNREVAQLARALEIDIAVDLKGYTEHSRPGIFAARAAPLQVSYLGYPGTMGAAYIDYLIADSTVVPEASQGYYTEKLLYLPDSYQVTDQRHEVGEGPSRDQLGLPRHAVVFCCFNDSYKITPALFSVWMRILERTGDSVLWLLGSHPAAARNLRAEAERRGVSPRRLMFAPRVPRAEHLARQRAADLFLDTFPCNAHTTASDALWAGLPLLTCSGESFASRVAASLLKAVGLPELITDSLAQYEALAVELGSQPARLAALSCRLGAQRAASPLFDTRRKTRQLEAAYRAIQQRYRDGQPPAHLHIADVQGATR
jgi:predicted O-linked N-acetylglucosamine transferase (SPINDLY family)